MADKEKKSETQGKSRYPQHYFASSRLLDFIEFRRFTADWSHLGLDDDALRALQLLIIADPDGASVVAGTGGLRKLRFAPASWKTGKSGAVRICYVYFKDHAIIYLLRAYAKHEKDDLTDKEKSDIQKLLQRIGKELSKRPLTS